LGEKKMAKIKMSENKASDIETNQTEKLWSEYGKLSLRREQALALIRQVAPIMNELYDKIMVLEKKKSGSSNSSTIKMR